MTIFGETHLSIKWEDAPDGLSGVINGWQAHGVRVSAFMVLE